MSWTMTEKEHEQYGGVHRHYHFGNEVVLSAIRTYFSYGGKEGLWEIGVVNKEGWLTQQIFPSAGDDVIGWLTEEELLQYVNRVAEWESKNENEVPV
jgi:hypothetical protein